MVLDQPQDRKNELTQQRDFSSSTGVLTTRSHYHRIRWIDVIDGDSGCHAVTLFNGQTFNYPPGDINWDLSTSGINGPNSDMNSAALASSPSQKTYSSGIDRSGTSLADASAPYHDIQSRGPARPMTTASSVSSYKFGWLPRCLLPYGYSVQEGKIILPSPTEYKTPAATVSTSDSRAKDSSHEVADQLQKLRVFVASSVHISARSLSHLHSFSDRIESDAYALFSNPS